MQDRRCVCVFLPNDDTLNVIVNVSERITLPIVAELEMLALDRIILSYICGFV